MTPGLGAAKAAARDLVSDLLFRTKVTAPARCLSGNLTIVTFHRVLTQEQVANYPLPGLSVTPDELDAHLKFLTKHFRCMSLAKALDAQARPRESAEAPLLAVTFDDGQLDNFDNALPVLEQNAVSASFYIPSQILEDTAPLWHDRMARAVFALRDSESAEAAGLLAEFALVPPVEGVSASAEEWSVEQTKLWPPEKRKTFMDRADELGQVLGLPRSGRPPWDAFMSVEQLRELVRRGHEVGAHSHSHALLPQLGDAELHQEVVESKRLLEAALGSPIETFCYPNGDSDPRIQEAVRSAGYRAAVTTAWGSNPPQTDAFTLRRCDMHAQHAKNGRGEFSEARLAWRISGKHPGLRGTNDARP